MTRSRCHTRPAMCVCGAANSSLSAPSLGWMDRGALLPSWLPVQGSDSQALGERAHTEGRWVCKHWLLGLSKKQLTGQEGSSSVGSSVQVLQFFSGVRTDPILCLVGGLQPTPSCPPCPHHCMVGAVWPLSPCVLVVMPSAPVVAPPRSSCSS